MKILFYILIFSELLISCNDIAVISNNTNDNRKAIFHEKFAFNPDTSFQIGDNRILFLKKFEFDEDSFKLYVFKKTESNWQLIKDSVFLYGYDLYIDSPKVILINGEHFLYDEELQSGGSLGNFDIEYSLYKLSSLEKFFIHYTELPEGNKTITDVTKSSNLSTNKLLLSYLEAKLNNSTRVHKLTDLDSLINRFKEVNKKTLLNINSTKYLNKPQKFKYVSSKSKIFDIHNRTTMNDSISAIADFIENDRFIVTSLFKGSVLGYNKSEAEYFFIWSPESLFYWIEKIEFDSKGNLLFYEGESGHHFMVNLIQFEYLRTK